MTALEVIAGDVNEMTEETGFAAIISHVFVLLAGAALGHWLTKSRERQKEFNVGTQAARIKLTNAVTGQSAERLTKNEINMAQDEMSSVLDKQRFGEYCDTYNQHRTSAGIVGASILSGAINNVPDSPEDQQALDDYNAKLKSAAESALSYVKKK